MGDSILEERPLGRNALPQIGTFSRRAVVQVLGPRRLRPLHRAVFVLRKASQHMSFRRPVLLALPLLVTRTQAQDFRVTGLSRSAS